jgi:hypothetical protein
MRHSGTSSLKYLAFGLEDTCTVIMLAWSPVAKHLRRHGIYSYKLEVQVTILCVVLEGFLLSVKIIAYK